MDEDWLDTERERDDALDRLLSDPMFAAALEAHGLRRGALPWETEECSTFDAVKREGRGLLPALIVDSNGEGNLWWHSLAGHSISYDHGKGGRVMTISDIAIPSTTLTALTGRTLDAVAGLPGAEGLTIVEAEAVPVIDSRRMGARITVELRVDNRLAEAA